MIRRIGAILVTASALAACVDTGAEATGDCDAAAYQSLIGAPVAEAEAVAARAANPGDVRVIGPDTAVTMDYREDRLNFTIDASGRITRAYCG